MEIQASTPDRFNDICKALWKVNLLIAYPLSDAMIEVWGKHLIRLCPDVKVDELDKIMDKFISGEIEYVANKGLANIVKILKPNTFTLPKR